jgi:hypothetical protein
MRDYAIFMPYVGCLHLPVLIVGSVMTSFYVAQLNAPKWGGMVDLRAELALSLAATTNA